jgi:dynein heavy chain
VEGPYGTGKTETVKDLAKTHARPLHTLNSSADCDYSEILKFYKGIVSSGAWVLFDEFNRIGLQMMNYVTQLVHQLQSTVRGQMHYITVDDSRIHLDSNCAIFLTMNPGYAGRVEMP